MQKASVRTTCFRAEICIRNLFRHLFVYRAPFDPVLSKFLKCTATTSNFIGPHLLTPLMHFVPLRHDFADVGVSLATWRNVNCVVCKFMTPLVLLLHIVRKWSLRSRDSICYSQFPIKYNKTTKKTAVEITM